jgi:hypothetical protein
MREEHRPVVADPLVEVNWTLRRFGGEVGSYIVDAKRHRLYLPYLFIESLCV